MAKIACVAVVKNEERHIAEWIAYQYAIGFDTVVLLDNLSTDHTYRQALAFQPAYDLRLLTSPDTTASYQTSAYLGAIEKFGAEFEWMAFFDTDEFLVFEDGWTLQKCLAGRAACDAIGINWAVFGSSSHRDVPEGLIIENYKYRSDLTFGPNKHIKSIIRPHRAKGILNGHMFAVDNPYESLSGTPITWQSPGVVAGTPDYQCGKLHHYFTRSWQNWVAKLQRGYPDIERQAAEFDEYDRNEVFDDSAVRVVDQVTAILEVINIAKKRVSLVSCAPSPLYRTGGFYGPAEELSALYDGEDSHARSITIIGEVYPSASYSRRLPLAILTSDSEFRESLKSQYQAINQTYQQMPPSFMVTLKNAAVFHNVIYLDNDVRHVVYETYRSNDRENVPFHKGIFETKQCPPQDGYLDFFLGSAGTFNYGHWLTDDLPRAAAFLKLAKLDSPLRIWVTSYNDAIDSVRVASLQMLFKDKIKIEIQLFDPNTALIFDRLMYVTPCSYHPVLKAPSALDFLARQIDTASMAPAAERIFVTRRWDRGRSLTNIVEIEDQLTRLGFQTIDVEEMSFQQQAGAFSQAKIIIGCMGAAMANTIFAKPGTAVIYLVPIGWVEPYYWDISAIRRHNYIVCFGPAENGMVAPHVSSYRIEPGSLAMAMEIALQYS